MRMLSIAGLLAGVVCLGIGTALKPGGFDWTHDYISTMLRGPAGPTRTMADIGALFFCLSIALIFARLAQAPEFSRYKTLIRVGGIGSMVYSAFTITPMHDLMVKLSFLFFLAAAIPIVLVLCATRRFALLALGCASLVIFIGSIAIYYSDFSSPILPWAQRVNYGLFAVWLVALDYTFSTKSCERSFDLSGKSVVQGS